MFFGSYDGGNHYIYNLNVDRKFKVSGLFGYIRGNYSDSKGNKECSVSNLVVYGSVKNAVTDAGGITGHIHYGAAVRNCAFIGSIQSENRAGGITGDLYAGGTITDCYHNGTVTAGKTAGGSAGIINFGEYGKNGENSVVQNCYHANGSIAGSENSGAITGLCYYYQGIDNKIYIQNCYCSSESNIKAVCDNATSDETSLLSQKLMKNIAGELGKNYTDNPNSELNNGYPVFSWQTAISGDINQDGAVSVNDAVLMQKYLHSKQKFTKEQYQKADMNGDGKVNVYDMILLKRELLKK